MSAIFMMTNATPPRSSSPRKTLAAPSRSTLVRWFRVRVVRVAPDDHRLYFSVHHIVFDGVAIYRVILPELAALYETFANGEPASLDPPALSYGDYVAWQPEHLASPAIRRQLEQWRTALADARSPVELPADHPRPLVQSYAGDQVVFRVSQELTDRLRALARTQGVTLYMTLLASFHALMHRYTGEEDIVVGGVNRPAAPARVGARRRIFSQRHGAACTAPRRTAVRRLPPPRA